MWHPDIEDTPPLKSSKSKTLPKFGATALVASTPYLASLHPRKRRKQQNAEERDELSPAIADGEFSFILQPKPRSTSQEQLVAEMEGFYAGLTMVEAKCNEADNLRKTLPAATPQCKLTNEQRQSLIALHRTLLYEHHDFFLASQHPSSSETLRRLASRYAMPARMWRHGIHSFLELLRHRETTKSLDHMVAFVYLAYSMTALLYETVPAFEDTWIECLGDFARYRQAIADDDIRDRETWLGVGRHWYCKSSNTSPTTGDLYHHLAVLARPNALQQLYYYSNLLCPAVPFTSARDSILTDEEQVLSTENGQYRLPTLDTPSLKAHGLHFTNTDIEKFEPTVIEFSDLLDAQIGTVTRKFMEEGYNIAVANSIAMRGCVWNENSWPDNWFSDRIDEKDQYAELPLVTPQLRERILWLAALSDGPESVLEYTSAMEDPVNYGCTRPGFSVSTNQDTSYWGSSTFASTTDALDGPWASIEASFDSNPTWEAKEGPSSWPTNDTLFMDGINATLAFQSDTVEAFIGVPHNMTEINAEDEPSFLMTAGTETLESWLSEFIDLDSGFDERENIDPFQVSKQNGRASQTLGDVTSDSPPQSRNRYPCPH
jgi:hypothetical protein